MDFTSVSFSVLLVIVVTAYYLTRQSHRWMILLLASYAFYLISSPKTLIFMLFTTAVTFYGGKGIYKCNVHYQAWLKGEGGKASREEKKAYKAQNQKQKRKYVAAVLLVNFGVLAFVKYFRYYLGALGIDWSLFDAGILIPLGISFYTFQSAAYIMDIYRSKIKADEHIFKFALFMSFFPQIIQGPIARYDHLAEQLYEGHAFKYENITYGAQLILWGFVKKLVIADRAALLVNTILDNPGEYLGFYIVLALFMYSIQIYGDFSGGIDIARGAAQCMGINMADNFRRPYFANSLSEFWRRWHITLSNWCRDYIFYPIAMSKAFGKIGKNLRNVLGDRLGKLFPVIIAQMATFIVIGVWHGAEFKFIAYGLYNGIIIVMGLIMEPYLRKAEELLHIDTETFSWKCFKIIRTFCIVMFGRILARSACFTVAIGLLRDMLVFNPGIILNDHLLEIGLSQVDWIILISTCVLWLIASLMAENGIDVRKFISQQNIPVRWGIWFMAIIVVMIFGIYGSGYDAGEFIYREF